MNAIETAAADLTRLAVAGKGSFLEHPDPAALSRYVSKLMVPQLREALQEVSVRILLAHRVGDLGQVELPARSSQLVPVVHYTSLGTTFHLLRSALEGNSKASLRLYDSEHTNDPEEGRFLFRALDLPPNHHWAAAPTPSHAYLTSFLAVSSEVSGERGASDDLNFWRSYGRDGQGCSFLVWVPEGILRKVLYGREAALNLRTDLLKLLDALDPIAELHEEVRSVFREALWDELGGIRYLYKDAAYTDEKEYRVVILQENIDEKKVQFDFRILPDSLRRYYEHSSLVVTKLFDQSGSSITIGPDAPHKEDLRYSLDLIRRRAGLDKLVIKTSQIPYRST